MLISRLQKLQWIAALTVIVLAAPSHSQAGSPPPLKPNEVIVKTKDGCGFVIDPRVANIGSKGFSELTWGGACIDGLAMGEGRVSNGELMWSGYLPSNGWVWHGRLFGSIEFRRQTGLAGVMYIWDDKSVSYNTLSTSKPVWDIEYGGTQYMKRSSVSDENSTVSADTLNCWDLSKLKVEVPECSDLVNSFSFYGVSVFGKQSGNVRYTCPDPRSTQGCEALWAQHAGPVIERIKAFLAENEPKAEARKREIAPLITSAAIATGSHDRAASDAARRAAQLAERAEFIAKRDKGKSDLNSAMQKLEESREELKQIDTKIAAAKKTQAERNAQDRREALGILLGAVGQYQQIKSGQRQAQHEEQSSISTPTAGLSQQQVSACSEEIKRTQIESQRWGGDVNAVANRLGRFQKELFEGRCAGHPEARAYIAGANKMMGYSVNAGNGSSLPPLTSAGGTGSSGSPDPSRSRKVHNPAADAKGCSKLIPSTEWIGKSAMGGNFRFVNDCPTKVEFFWCSDNECTRDRGNTWTISAGGNWPVSGTDVRWGACRGANSGGFDKGSQGTRYTCPSLEW